MPMKVPVLDNGVLMHVADGRDEKRECHMQHVHRLGFCRASDGALVHVWQAWCRTVEHGQFDVSIAAHPRRSARVFIGCGSPSGDAMRQFDRSPLSRIDLRHSPMHALVVAAGTLVVSGCHTAPAPSASVSAASTGQALPSAGSVVRASLPRIRATLPDSTFWPEGMDYDARTGRYYVASVRHGTIAEVTSGGSAREIIARHSLGIGSMLGVRVDPAGGVLWATTSGRPQLAGYQPADSAIAALLRVRISDGTVEQRWDLAPSPRGHTLGDLAVGPAGDVYVTDSNEPVLYRLRPGASALEPMTDSLFKSLQGLAPSPDGRWLYLADYSRGLLRVDLATKAVTLVADSTGRSLRGCDGIAWYRGDIIAVQNGASPARVIRIALDPTGAHIVGADVVDSDPAVADEPTIGAVVGDDFVYVANSQWEKYDRAGTLLPTAVLRRPVLLATPLKR
jgi:sugar lactone lactonase YvrE